MCSCETKGRIIRNFAGGIAMAVRENCVYCGKPIEKGSREHIIQNALGGLYESENICCDNCNKTVISQKIDVPFTKIFNPIITRIENFAKTNNTKSKPSCTGKAKYGSEIYEVIIKNGKVVSCPELSKKMKCDVSKLDFEILAYDFQLDNASFQSGIGKIAFNFALDKGIPLDVLSKGVEISKSGDVVENIYFKFPVIPFVALNPLDKYLELETSMELYHNLILFSQGNMLWCYVDLFNTFQYYVLLSNEWEDEVHILETYLQLLQKLDRTIPELHIRKPKHILTYAMYFNVKPCMDLDVFRKRVKEAIEKESLKKDMADVVSAKLGMDYFKTDIVKGMEMEEARSYYKKEMGFHLESLLLYFDEDDRLKDDTFRQVTQISHNEVVSYPLLINKLAQEGKVDIRWYTGKKFERLNSFLVGIDKIEASEDIEE